MESVPRDLVRASVVEAAAGLLAEHGAAALTTRAVAQAAGVQAPTIYRLFGDKDGLVAAVAEHVMATHVAAEQEQARDEGADPVQDLRAAWRRHVAFGLAHPELYALLSARPRGASSPATDAGSAVLRARVHRLAAAGLLRVPEARAMAMVHAAGSGTVLALLDVAPEQRDPGLADAVVEAVLSAVTTSSPAVGASTTQAVLVAAATVVPDLLRLSAAERALLAEWLERALD